MTIQASDLRRIDPRKDNKESFTIEIDHSTQTITLTMNGHVMNKIQTNLADSLYDRMLKFAKLKFLRLRGKNWLS
jgi:hypothetical protein